MRILMRVVAGLAVAAAAVLAVAVPSSGSSRAVAAASCNVPDYAATHGPGIRTPGGWADYESWIANDQSQAALDDLQSALSAHFGLGDDSGDAESLAAGLVGVALDDASQTVNVVVDPTVVNVGALQRELAPAARGRFHVLVRPGCSTASDLAAARAVLDGLGASFAPDGWGFYLDAHDSTYHVDIAPQDKGAAAALAARLGDRVTIAFDQLSLTDRLNDGQPHYGGSGIHPGALSSNNCTSAFVVNLPGGGRGAVTAGHCFVDTGTINNRNVRSGSVDYGGVTSGAYDYPNFDMVRINNGGQSWDNRIHTDPCCPDPRNVITSGNPAVGDFICNSGMVTRAICGLTVTNIDQTVCFSDGGCRLHMIRATRNGDVVVHGGDSGGPMYNRLNTNDAAARGMIIGGGNCNANVACTIAFGHRISAVIGHLSVTIATS